MSCARAQAGDLRAHGDQAVAQIFDLRLARGIADDGFALGQGRGHQRGFGGADRDEGKFDRRALEAVLGAVAMT